MKYLYKDFIQIFFLIIFTVRSALSLCRILIKMIKMVSYTFLNDSMQSKSITVGLINYNQSNTNL
jgi:hypothetical protein